MFKRQKKAKKETKSEPKSLVGSVISHDQVKRKLQEDSNIEFTSKKQKKTMYGKRDAPSVEALGSVRKNDNEDILHTTPPTSTITMPVEDFNVLIDFLR